MAAGLVVFGVGIFFGFVIFAFMAYALLQSFKKDGLTLGNFATAILVLAVIFGYCMLFYYGYAQHFQM